MTEQDPVDAWVVEALREVRREEELTQEDAARALGIEEAGAAGEEVSPADAVRMLGGTPNEQLAAAQPGRRNRRRDLERAQEALGAEQLPRNVNSPFKRMMYFLGPWRYQFMSHCHRVQDQMRIVAYLEDTLTGKETEIPAEVAETVRKLVEHSRRQTRGFIPPVSSRQQYESLARAYRQHKAQQQGRLEDT